MLGCWVAGTIIPPSDGPIFQQCLQNSFHNYFYYFYCFIFFYNLKRLSHQPTVLFPIYQNNDWTIRRWDVGPINSGTQRIILKIVGFLETSAKKYEKFRWFFGVLEAMKNSF